jgi:dTDP-glucose 4,6-dehydratase
LRDKNSEGTGVERFCVIGSNSFSGASFVAGALREGAAVLGISRSPEPDPVLLPYRWGNGERFTFRQLDLNRDLDAVDAAIREFRPDYVVNFAAQGMVAQSWSRPEHWYRTNTVAMALLHERLRTMEFLKKFVQASTPEVYGNTSGLVTEDAPFNPSTPYAISKAACDMNLLAYRKAYGFPVVFTRSANVCGPAQALYRIIPKTALCVLTGKRLRLEGGGTSVRSFIHIDDVTDATLSAARTGEPGSVFHLSTPRNQTIREVVEEVCRQLGAPFADSVEVVGARLGQDAAYLLDSTAARTKLGWAPRRSVEDAIADTVGWMKKNLARLRELPAEYVHKE